MTKKTVVTPVKKIAQRRIKQDAKRCILLSSAVMFSMLLISFFIFFSLRVMTAENSYGELPFWKFLDGTLDGMRVTVVFLIIITAITTRTYCRLRAQETDRTLAVLTSVGATAKERRALIFEEIRILYIVPVLAGVLTGALSGSYMARYFIDIKATDPSVYIRFGYAAILLAVLGIVLAALCHIMPERKRNKTSVIGKVRRQNAEVSAVSHSYHQSKTYREGSITKRLSKRSIYYYRDTYNKIALSFAASALYPILAFSLIGRIVKIEIVLDENPYGGPDTSAAVFGASSKMLMFLLACFLALTVVGILEALMITRLQIERRRKTARVYRSVGMQERHIRRMIRSEILGTVERAVIYTVICIPIINAIYDIVLSQYI